MKEQKSVKIQESNPRLKRGFPISFGKMNTVWRALTVDLKQKTALMLAESPVHFMPYMEERLGVNWELCDVRMWLNGDYYKTFFTDEEKEAISDHVIENIVYYDTDDEESDYFINNKFFLLTNEEVEQYLKRKKDRRLVDANDIRTSWWIRPANVAFCRNVAPVVDRGGSIELNPVNDATVAVRPCFILNLQSEYVKKNWDRIISGNP